MSSPPESDPILKDDLDLLNKCAELQAQLIEHGIPGHVLQALEGLKERMTRRLREARSQAAAVAEANARAVEMSAGIEEVAQQMRTQNAELERQNAEILKAREDLERQARAAADANVDALMAVEESEARRDSVEKLLPEMEERSVALAEANAESTLMLLELEKKAFIDVLTGLFNHRYFRENIKLEVARAHRYGRNLTLAFFDADHFKRINDTHGHPTGDLVLQRISEVLRNATRAADIPVRLEAKPFAARYGGEEFVVILPETDLEGGVVLAERIRETVAAMEFYDTAEETIGKVTLSAGVASLNLDDKDDVPETLVRRADDALYAAKEGGRNRVEAAK